MRARAVITGDSMIAIVRGEPLPFRVEVSDLETLETTTHAFRVLDYRCGGGVLLRTARRTRLVDGVAAQGKRSATAAAPALS